MEKINRNNYEIWMIDYLDGNLDNDMEYTLFCFLEKNPDLRTELDLVENVVLTPEKISFNKKHLLLKSTNPHIEMPESDYLLIKQMEEGLSLIEKNRLQELEKIYPAMKNDFSNYKLTKLQPKHILFPQKSSLLRKNIKPYIWSAISSVAAAVILLLFVLKPFENSEIEVQSLTFNVQSSKPENLDIETETLKSKYHSLTMNTETLISNPKTLNTNPETNNIQQTPYSKRQIPNISSEIIAFIPKPELQIFPQISKINAYEVGLTLMIPQYIENQNLISALEVDFYEEDNEHERSLIVRAGERLLNRIIAHNMN